MGAVNRRLERSEGDETEWNVARDFYQGSAHENIARYKAWDTIPIAIPNAANRCSRTAGTDTEQGKRRTLPNVRDCVLALYTVRAHIDFLLVISHCVRGCDAVVIFYPQDPRRYHIKALAQASTWGSLSLSLCLWQLSSLQLRPPLPSSAPHMSRT